VIKLLMIKF